ncbi:hypothetical protein, partial [Salmonella enterica]|uniref:hypothetical protein n=1 Tax=Salmonella enterica TaxID=28901 RepID=UPI003EDBED18
MAKKPRSHVIVGMDKNSQLYRVDKDKTEPLGTLAEVFGVDTAKAPREMTELSLMGKSISLGFVFAYYLGLTGMLKHFGISYEVLSVGQRIDKGQFDSIIRLQDAK